MSTMRTINSVCIVFGFLSVTILSGCKSPYALKTSAINYDAKQIAGSIHFTDPKLYKREALINERNAETTYLQDLLKNSVNAQFHPEILRELQTIASLAAALGVRFDPGAA